MRVLVIDYKMNNLGSITRALEECGATVVVSDNPAMISSVDKIVLPGVGAFGQAMIQLQQLGFVDALREAVKIQKKPLLGICLGMQLLASVGFEGGENKGLDFISGSVRRLPVAQHVRLPHMGWNDVTIARDHAMVHYVPSGSDFYFVHSYAFFPEQQDVIVVQVLYGCLFPALIQQEHVVGVQFHPEKSSTIGFQVLRNFLRM